MFKKAHQFSQASTVHKSKNPQNPFWWILFLINQKPSPAKEKLPCENHLFMNLSSSRLINNVKESIETTGFAAQILNSLFFLDTVLDSNPRYLCSQGKSTILISVPSTIVFEIMNSSFFLNLSKVHVSIWVAICFFFSRRVLFFW